MYVNFFFSCVLSISYLHTHTFEPAGEKCEQMFSVQGFRRHKMFCTGGMKLCPVCKIMIKTLDFQNHFERCKDPSVIAPESPIGRQLKNTNTASNKKKSNVRVNRSHSTLSSPPVAASTAAIPKNLQEQYKSIFHKRVPRKFRGNEKWIREKISLASTFSPGQNVFVSASSFGLDWAKQEFGSSWKSAVCEGKLGKYNKKKGMWEVRYENDRNVYYFKEKDFIITK